LGARHRAKDGFFYFHKTHAQLKEVTDELRQAIDSVEELRDQLQVLFWKQ
jgi:hypothetical protein